MSFAQQSTTSNATAAPVAPAAAAPVGKGTLPEAAASESPASGGAKAEMGGGAVRASNGPLNEGAGPGILRGGGGKGKKHIGAIVGGTFQKSAAPAAGAAPAGEAPAAKGAEGERAYTGTPAVADRKTNDGTTTVRMEDESDAQALVIAAAVTRARAILDNAISKIGSASSPQVQKALQDNFHSTDAKVISKVSANLSKIRSAFDGTIPVEVESDGDARAYVYAIWSDIHLCPPWFADPSADGRARTIIHECSHKYTGTDDKAYHWDAKYQTLSTKDALNNADSHAWFCIDVL